MTGLTVDKTTTKSITLSWNPQVNIDGYILCVWNKNDAAWDRVVKIADPYTYSYTHTGLKAGTEYSYSVVAYYKSGSSYKYTGRTSALSTYTGPAAPDNIIVSGRTEASVKLSWRKVNRASGYLIYVYDNASKNYNRVGKVSDASVLSYNVTGLKSTTTYTFAVKAYVQENGSIGYGDKKTISTCTTPVTPSNTFKYTKMGSHTYLKWSSISGASGYIVYKYNKKTNAYTKIKTLTGAASSSFVGPNLPAQYGYRIRAFIKNNGHTYVGKISDAPSKISGTLYGTVIDSWVYVRAGAGTNHSIVATLPKNRTVRIVGVRKSAKGDYWYKVSFTSGKKTKTGYSTAADVLEKLAPEHPVVAKILEYRQYTKLKSTYADGLANYIQDDGRIHGKFNQTITATGRISSTEPNLQNIPVRMELGRLIRKVFIPEEGYRFVDADYSQIELRVLAHCSGDEHLIQAYKEQSDIHRITASQVFHIPFDEVTPQQRRNAKAVNFGIVYGISSFGLSQDLSITRKEAAKYIDDYFATYPGIKTFLDHAVTHAKEEGYVVTLFGRRRPVPELSSSNFMQRSFGERVAMNSPIQGAAADIIKIAMIRVNQRLKDQKMKSRLVLQVHDELLIEAYEPELDEVQNILKEEMEHAAELKVPLEIDMHTGDNWYEAK